MQVDAQEYLVNRDAWTPDAAEALALSAGIDVLTDKHWRVLALCREDAARRGRTPNLKRLLRLVRLDRRQLRQLFPGDAAGLVARIAGLPRPEITEMAGDNLEITP